MPRKQPRGTRRTLLAGALGTAAVATAFNLVLVPAWFLLALAFGSSDVGPGTGIFAACEPGSETCAGPNFGMVIIILLALVAVSAGAAKLGQILGGTNRNSKIFRMYWLLAGIVMAIEALFFIF